LLSSIWKWSRIMKRLFWILSLVVAFNPGVVLGQRHGFTVEDDIGLARLGDSYAGLTSAVTVSPNTQMVVIHSERGSLRDDLLHDELRVYDMRALQRFVDGPEDAPPPQPIWIIREATNKDGQNFCLVSRIKWLANSAGFAFSLRNETGHTQLVLADTLSRTTTYLTPANHDVTGFAIRDSKHYVFTVKSGSIGKKLINDDTVSLVIDKQPLLDLLSPTTYGDRSDLWAATGGSPAPVTDAETGKTIGLYEEGIDNLSLSPDGKSLLTPIPVKDIPKAWEMRFPPPYHGCAFALKAGQQDLNAPFGLLYVSEYAKIDLVNGTITRLIGTPTAERTGWWANYAAPAWSDDGRAVILPGAFPKDQPGSDPRPCVAVKAPLTDDSLECVEPLKRNLADGFEAGYETVSKVNFVAGRHDAIVIGYTKRDAATNDISEGYKTFVRAAPRTWTLQSDQVHAPSQTSLTVEVKMSFKEPPKLIATDTLGGRSRIVWDPNPQLNNIDLGTSSIYHWQDNTGRAWNAILFRPIHFVPGKRYPLIIGNHGYNESKFEPSGGFPSAYAAQELAAAGFVVLQMQDCAGRSTPLEGPCNVMGYESAVDQLAKDGMIDPERVGIIGFSRTVFYVMDALATSKFHFKAASVTDGVNVGYFQHILTSGFDAFDREDLAIIGAQPFGPGLQQWLERSPEFNLDKVTTPLRIVGLGVNSSITNWEPYALLRAMHRPVEFVVLNTREHIVTNPKVRLAAQGGNFDWFRFWLQEYEDPDPSKAGQYRRWEHLRDLRDADLKATQKLGQTESGR
jgi:hypothetical protein